MKIRAGKKKRLNQRIKLYQRIKARSKTGGRAEQTGLLAPKNLFIAGYLFFYALIILLADPEWLRWAGPIVLGALPVSMAPPIPFDPFEAFQAAAVGVMLGMLALVILIAVNGNPRTGTVAADPREY